VVENAALDDRRKFAERDDATHAIRKMFEDEGVSLDVVDNEGVGEAGKPATVVVVCIVATDEEDVEKGDECVEDILDAHEARAVLEWTYQRALLV
jgi:hypothetical protein